MIGHLLMDPYYKKIAVILKLLHIGFDELNYHLASITIKMRTEIIGKLNKKIGECNRLFLTSSTF